MPSSIKVILIGKLLFLTVLPLLGNSLNVATAGKYPYSDPKGGRENHFLSGEKVNEARVYNFTSDKLTITWLIGQDSSSYSGPSRFGWWTTRTLGKV